jgi:hypothetical protein
LAVSKITKVLNGENKKQKSDFLYRTFCTSRNSRIPCLKGDCRGTICQI